MRKRYLFLFLLSLIILPLLFIKTRPPIVSTQPTLAQTTSGRVQVANLKGYGKTVVTSQNTPLRGGAVWNFQYDRQTHPTRYSSDRAYWQKMKDNGLNAVRVINFDPWQRSEGYAAMDLNKAKDVDDFLKELDRLIDLAQQSEMYAVINYHDVGRYQDCAPKDSKKTGQDVVCQSTLNYITQFWKLVAPRYKDRAHVIYELTNEPVSDRNGAGWFPNDMRVSPYLEDQKKLYDLVRSLAPKTHIILISFANTHTFGNPRTLKTVVNDLNKIGNGIDWSNASVGFHPYVTGGKSQEIRDLMANYPVVNTEANFPPEVAIQNPDQQKSQPMDGEKFNVQTMERLGISWFHWKIEGNENLQNNYINVLLKDAKEKKYIWFK